MSLDKLSILVVITINRQIVNRPGLDASHRVRVPGNENNFLINKKRLLRAALERGKGRREVSSGKAMQDDEVEACARTTLVMESKNLEEG
jgi:hypothetical protein